jgi:hypothetical protein
MNRKTFLLLATIGVAGPIGCGLPVRPDPTKSVERLARAVASGQASAAWKALPGGWQADLTGLVHDAAGTFDRDAYDKVFVLLEKSELLLRTKKDFILGSSRFAADRFDRVQLERNWGAATSILKTIAASDARSLDRLARLDVGRFTKKTGDRVLRHLIQLAKAVDGELPDQFAALRSLEARTLAQDGDTATIAVTFRGETEELAMVRVDGRWVPADLAGEWDEMIARLRHGLANLSIAGSTMQVMQALGIAEASLDGLLAARTQQQFDAAIAQLDSMEPPLPPPW